MIISDPVYWLNPPGIMKDFIDRTVSLFNRPTPPFENRKVVLVTIAAEDGFELHSELLSSWLKAQGAELIGGIDALAWDKDDLVHDRPQQPRLARFASEIRGKVRGQQGGDASIMDREAYRSRFLSVEPSLFRQDPPVLEAVDGRQGMIAQSEGPTGQVRLIQLGWDSVSPSWDTKWNPVLPGWGASLPKWDTKGHQCTSKRCSTSLWSSVRPVEGSRRGFRRLRCPKLLIQI